MDFCRQCANEENRERATKRIESSRSLIQKKGWTFSPALRPTTRRRVDDVRGKSALGPRRASSRHAVRGALTTIHRSIDRSIDRWSREPIPRAPPPISTIRPDEKNSRPHAPCFPWNRETNPRERQRCASPASSSETKRSVSHSVHPSIHPSRSSSSYLSSRIHQSSIIIRPRSGIESNARSLFAHAPHGRRATC